jgi:nucleoside-diphosphate-sugar epimerase
MKVLVTGAAGFLGMAVVERLLARGFTDIRCTLRRQADIPKLEDLLTGYPNASLEYCVGNLRHREDAIRAVRDAKIIFHLAAGKGGAPADLFLDTVVASRNLLEAIDTNEPVRVVLASSFGVYGFAGLGGGSRVNESTPLEPHPERRDPYSHAKLRQERMFHEYQKRDGFELVILRPGVIYGPGGSHFSDRVGLKIGKLLLQLGGTNVLPLTYVDNCAEAIVVAGTHARSAGQVYNVHDDNLPTCRQYLCAYRKHVANVRSLRIPYTVLRIGTRILEKYNRYSKGQLPSIFTSYKISAQWRGFRFDNSKIRSIGWRQLVTTSEGLQRAFEAFRSEMISDPVQVASAIRGRKPQAGGSPVEFAARPETEPTSPAR